MSAVEDAPVTEAEVIDALERSHRPHVPMGASAICESIARHRDRGRTEKERGYRGGYRYNHTSWPLKRWKPVLDGMVADGTLLAAVAGVSDNCEAMRVLGVLNGTYGRRYYALPEHAAEDRAALARTLDAVDHLGTLLARLSDRAYVRPDSQVGWVNLHVPVGVAEDVADAVFDALAEGRL